MKIEDVHQPYIEYEAEKTTKRAIDGLIEFVNGKNMPVENWEDQRGFHQAIAMAANVRSSYAVFLYDIWNATWGTLDFSKLEEDTDDVCTSEDIWDDSTIYRSFRFEKPASKYEWITFSVLSTDEKGIRLALEFLDAKENLISPPDNADLDGWEIYEDDGTEYLVTTSALNLEKINDGFESWIAECKDCVKIISKEIL